MVPGEGEPIWNDAIMWRGTSPARHFLGGNAMFLAGHDSQRFVAYPLTPEVPATRLATINWIAEMRVDPARAMSKGDWSARWDAFATPKPQCEGDPLQHFLRLTNLVTRPLPWLQDLRIGMPSCGPFQPT